ncbi:death-associated protein kinase 1 isoform X2 [Tribolium castaneum]|uniref:Death-associated protein kinase dapk-1-like Protein n=1 Tax=Tribolium castaneum TaxID=7070 RepID=D6WVZ0_TRICA|nr:PREDICTED: death-associated protein kinase 1 isoform X2 [Tribolium castaneum]EFA08636.2 Death-associated protein kinase dapk-1-like Protein [Tribolium castaneum]|eukprot:XP_008196671.1 PREDICTED: death-associated protein kinase 1 isoform X2 [Tribolium castaneum]
MNTSLSRGCSYSPRESFEYTALQFAARRGSLEQVRYLIESGTDLDTGPDPALHLALRKQNTAIAHVLLHAGADFEIKDSHGDYPIHIACTLGLLDVVHALCALGCSVEVLTAKGLSPLHLAAKNGHIHVVRCLCAAGCNIDIRNSDNIRADITALKYGHNDIAELLDRLRVTGQRDTLARQLVPTSKPALRLNLRLLGHCGVGKTSLVKSLSAGLFGSLFRRSSSLQSNKSRPSSPINTQIEMDVTSRQNSLSFESSGNYQSTNGISVQNMDISNVGETTVWEFSGQENYFPIYHHFLWPSPHSLTLVLFSLEDSPSIQVQQVCFWLNFLLARQPADLPSSEYGQVMLVATHVDLTRAVKTQNGEWICPDAQKTLETVRKIIPHVPNLMSSVVIMDTNVPASYPFKQLKSTLAELKQECLQQTVGTWTGLLEATLAWLNSLQKDYEQFPVLSRSTFSELLRSQVNILASDHHIQELLQQLHFMGEVFCVQDLVVVSVSWLGGQLLGELFSSDFFLHARVTGVYTSEDFQASFNQCDALGALDLLEALDVCVQCDIEGEIEYEFPIYNHVETLEGLWDSEDPRYASKGSQYGGLRLYTPPGTYHQFKSIFPHIQVELRRAILANYSNNDSDMDLYQWHLGSKLCNTELESLITLEEDEVALQFIEIKIRGPNNSSQYCFYFLEQIMQTINHALLRVCPGLLIEKHVLSPLELKRHSEGPFCYPSDIITTAMLEAESTLDVALYNPNVDAQETIAQLIMFSDLDLAGNIQWGCALRIQDLAPPIKLKLCGLLDPPERHGRDWCLLALRLGLCQDKIAALDSQHSSHTMRLLTTADCSIGALITSLHELDRLDAAEVVLRSAPIFKIIEHVSV